MASDKISCAIYLKLNKGVCIKGLFALFKEARLQAVSFIFRPDGVYIIERTDMVDANPIMFAVRIDSPNMTYQYNFPKTTTDGIPDISGLSLTASEFEFCVDVKVMVGIMHNCTKNDGIELFVYHEKPSDMHIVFSSNTTSNNLHTVTACSLERRRYIEQEYTTAKTASGPMKEFDNIIKGVKKGEAKTLTMTFSPTEVTFERDKVPPKVATKVNKAKAFDTNTAGSSSGYQFGQIDPLGAPAAPIEYVLDVGTIRALSKVSGICDKNDNVLLTAEPGKPLRLYVCVGNFGYMNMYLTE